MGTYIATFYSHFGAIRFHRQLKAQGIDGTLMPVPRKVSSSCGTCVRFQAEPEDIPSTTDVESVFHMENDDSFTLLRSSF